MCCYKFNADRICTQVISSSQKEDTTTAVVEAATTIIYIYRCRH
jgi:hypothetical protein